MNQKRNSPLERTLGMDQPSGWKRHLKLWVSLTIVLLIIIFGGIFILNSKDTNGAVRYKSQEVQRGDLTVTVSATGTLEPINEVDVGVEVSGTIKTVAADYNDHVKAGQVLARLDTSKLHPQVLQARAALASARAKVLRARADVRQTKTKLAQFQQARKSSGGKVPSQVEMDAAEAALAKAEADEASALADVSKAEAELKFNETNLSKAIIHSPIDGIVLLRQVEPGQTVAASLQTPVLFTIAEDLRKMELHVDVDEADVGQVKEGQEATFTVDAYPDKTFPARITQVRFGSKTVAGVVTYETVLNVNNSDLSLRPGMTATADIIVKNLQDAILVPNAALRFTPPIQEEEAPSNGGGLISQLLPRPPAPSKPREEVTADKKQRRVWTLREGQLTTIPVTTGSTDGIMTEVISGEVEPGMALVVDIVGTGG